MLELLSSEWDISLQMFILFFLLRFLIISLNLFSIEHCIYGKYCIFIMLGGY